MPKSKSPFTPEYLNAPSKVNERARGGRELIKRAAGTSPRPHLLLIDDDPTFRALVTRAAENRGILITACAGLREVRPMAVPNLFDAVIVDYYLDEMKLNLTGAQVAAALESTPVLLVSQSDHCVETNEAWPGSVRKFVSKLAGVEAILTEALALARPEDRRTI